MQPELCSIAVWPTGRLFVVLVWPCSTDIHCYLWITVVFVRDLKSFYKNKILPFQLWRRCPIWSPVLCVVALVKSWIQLIWLKKGHLARANCVNCCTYCSLCQMTMKRLLVIIIRIRSAKRVMYHIPPLPMCIRLCITYSLPFKL